MENGTFFEEDYYDSLLAEIREIRLSERRFYQIMLNTLKYQPGVKNIKFIW